MRSAWGLDLRLTPPSTFPCRRGAMITARQELCTNWSPASAGVKVDPHPASLPILFGPLHVGDAVTARQIICNFIVGPGEPVFVVSSAGFYYLTQHFDVGRTGWFPYETTLTVANVPHLVKKFTLNVDGTIYAQP